jgi:hypothetical protein
LSDSVLLAKTTDAGIIAGLDSIITDLVADVVEFGEPISVEVPPAPAPTPSPGFPDLGGIVSGIAAIPQAIAGIGKSLALVGKLAELTDLMHSPDEAIKMLQRLPDGELPDKLAAGGEFDIKTASWVGAIVGAPMGFLPMLSTIFSSGLGEKLAMTARSIYHPSRMSIAELAIALVRGNIEPDKFLEDASSQGFSEADALEYLKLTRQYLTAQDCIALWLRGALTEGELDAKLSTIGITDIDRKNLKTLAYFIPNVNDLIHMAVREAFTPEIAEKFGQYQDFPEAVAEWGEKQGLSKEWAQRYWAAHWELPGPAQGFEMYQRKIIDLDTLKMLLKALDVMPYWREQLIKLAYQPITRVDIRRIHKMKLIDDTELKQRYEAIGYSPDDADMLVKFTIELNKEEVKLETQGQRDLTASEILNAYANSAIGEPDTVAMLTDLGYDEAEVALKMLLAELPVLKRIRDKKVAIINQRLLYGAIDLNGAVDALNALDMPATEQEYVLADWQLDLELQQLKQEAADAKLRATKKATKGG